MVGRGGVAGGGGWWWVVVGGGWWWWVVGDGGGWWVGGVGGGWVGPGRFLFVGFCVGVLFVSGRRSVSGPALWVRARRSLCRAPALFVSGPGDLFYRATAMCQGEGVVGTRRSVALSVRARHFLCRARRLFASGLLQICVGARL